MNVRISNEVSTPHCLNDMCLNTVQAQCVKMLAVLFSKKLKQTHWFVWLRTGLSV